MTSQLVKPIEEIISCCVDYGSFVSLADAMARRVAHSYYYSPHEQEYCCIERSVIGDGAKTFERVDDIMEPEFFNSVDCWVFPDQGYGGLQRYLRSLGKPVFGSMGASDLELYRTKFLQVLKDLGLTVVPYKVCRGVTALSEHLKTVEDKWVKINRFRDNMETWHHIDYQHSQRELDRLASAFGPLKEHVTFVVQDPINGDDDSPVLEVGYDGLCIDGQYPSVSFQGYEKKNDLYLGSKLANEDLPEAVLAVNEAMAPILAGYGYRNFWATEIRIKDGEFHFIDPTARMAGQTQEHLPETCTNLPDVIYAGANGELLEPEFSADFAAEATMHYTAGAPDEWKTIRLPKSVQPWVKLYHYCEADGAYHFPPHKTDELGVVIGNGASVEAAIDDLKAHVEEMADEPIHVDVRGFAELLEQIKDAEAEGVEFSDQRVPEPEVVL